MSTENVENEEFVVAQGVLWKNAKLAIIFAPVCERKGKKVPW